MPGQSLSSFLTAALKDCTVSFTKHNAPFRNTQKCGARWPPDKIILNDITGTETRQTCQTWWPCPVLFVNGRIPYSCINLLQASACNMDTTPTQPHRNSNTHRTKNNTTNVVIQQNSRKLLMMDILMSETCSAHKK